MARSPFLDKFKATKSASGVRDSLAHIIRNIEVVLNTKQGYGSFLPDFGLGAYTAKYGSRDLIAKLTEEIQGEIEKHEPRFSEVEVVLEGRDSGLKLHFGVTGIINGEPCKLRLLFDTVSGGIQVEELP